jgi:hypothetical protein
MYWQKSRERCRGHLKKGKFMYAKTSGTAKERLQFERQA